MPIFIRTPFLFTAFLLTTLTTWSAPLDDKAKPVAPTPSPVAAPAFVDVVTFSIHVDGENHKTIVTTSPNQLRVDEVDDGFSVIYDPSTEHYLGLEHRNNTYWEFSWPEVRNQVEASKRGEDRLHELNSEGLNGFDSSPPTNAASTSSTSSGPDDSGYVWRMTTDQKKIADFDCVRWTGESVSGPAVEAWCVTGPQPQIQAAMEQLRAINDPMALVPVRILVPSLVFPVYDGLVKAGVTPVSINWGSDRKNQFAFVKAEQRNGKLSFFAIPKYYIKTTLVTMDGLIDQKK